MIFSFTVAIRKLRTKKASDDRKLKFDQLYCINELLANDVLLVCKLLLGYEEALWSKKLKIHISHGSQNQTIVRFWFFFSYLITTVLPWDVQTAQTEEFMFQNMAYIPTLYKNGAPVFLFNWGHISFFSTSFPTSGT